MIFHDLIPGDYFLLLQRTSAETSTAPKHSWVQLAAAGHSSHDCQLQATRLQPVCPPILTGGKTLTKRLLVLAETPIERCVPSEPAGGQATWCRPLLRSEHSDCKATAVSKPGGFDWRKWDNLNFQSTRKDDFRQDEFEGRSRQLHNCFFHLSKLLIYFYSGIFNKCLSYDRQNKQ